MITLEFVKRLQEQFSSSTSSYYYCFASKEFKELWIEDREFTAEIRGFAREFTAGQEIFKTGNGICLFYCDLTFDYGFREFRLDFLDWLIEKLEKQQSDKQ